MPVDDVSIEMGAYHSSPVAIMRDSKAFDLSNCRIVTGEWYHEATLAMSKDNPDAPKPEEFNIGTVNVLAVLVCILTFILLLRNFVAFISQSAKFPD